MAKRNSSENASSDREKWKKVFNAMALMLRTQQVQLDSLAKDRKLLEDRIKLQHERWVSDVNLFQEQIYQLKMEFTAQEMEHMVEAAKLDLVLGLKEREAYIHKDKSEKANGELEDFIECFGFLSRECSEAEGISSCADNKLEEKKKKLSLESELRRLKVENQQLCSKKSSEISALVAEKSFIWNQYDKLENDMTEQLKRKRAELEKANDKIEALLRNVEELQTSNTGMDNEIELLKKHVVKLEAASVKQNDEISSLSRELEALKKCKSDPATPTLRRCRTRSASLPRDKTKGMNGKSVKAEKGCWNSKRKQLAVITISDTPKLFTSSFKIPKLKTPSSPQVV
nr:spindle apparatus protein lin-5 [Ipomoea batatas]GME20113.1 spindle apparatus protein lin-5 [Ipomoea batatas]